MFKVVLAACLVAYAAAQLAEQYPPHPYSFSFESTDDTGARISQSESGDESNSKTGSYGYQTPDGVYRTVNYVADATGFHASIDTNEPGTKSEAPADVQINANPIEVKEAYAFKAKSA
ncbi:cuticle protein 10.9 [Ixodes scapularis]|uniref:Secreted salivary gland peptide, putative n=1 Tax=Ixodes scapularis TaxID=6945 RepID=B7P5P7_IXOSC|nr:cuticle protein 10.9 [Ixodes scapularis]EEC01919.1 secreted salivary gland peptide, putative [Ixodes scapularis]|eukprot:XP_002407787.1 secreted salivary gland peptide, putative [Ixodes scapularis]